MARVVEYEGTSTFTQFPIIRLTSKDCLTGRKDEFYVERLKEYCVDNLWLGYRQCVIDSSRDKGLLRRIKASISNRDYKALEYLFEEMVNDEQPLLKEIIKKYSKQESKSNRSDEYKQVKLKTHFFV